VTLADALPPNTAHQVFTVAELVAHASSVMTLEPGDVLITPTIAEEEDG
jgi:2-keto-4-pentenoate hydratase/2-oxohepta-3-ene-1,7-dioic acid hydratase in catechol pathway